MIARALKAGLLVLLLTTAAWADPLAIGPDQLSTQGHAQFQRTDDGGIHLIIDNPGDNSALVISPPTDEQAFDLSHWEQVAVEVQNLSKESQTRLLLSAATTGPEKKDNRDTN